jgi:hypothetical protein
MAITLQTFGSDYSKPSVLRSAEVESLGKLPRVDAMLVNRD